MRDSSCYFDEVNVATALHRLAKLHSLQASGAAALIVNSPHFKQLLSQIQRLLPYFEVRSLCVPHIQSLPCIRLLSCPADTKEPLAIVFSYIVVRRQLSGHQPRCPPGRVPEKLDLRMSRASSEPSLSAGCAVSAGPGAVQRGVGAGDAGPRAAGGPAGPARGARCSHHPHLPPSGHQQHNVRLLTPLSSHIFVCSYKCCLVQCLVPPGTALTQPKRACLHNSV